MSHVSTSLPSIQVNSGVDQLTLSNYVPLKTDPETREFASNTGHPVVWFARTEDGKKPEYRAFVFENGASLVGTWEGAEETLTDSVLTHEGALPGTDTVTSAKAAEIGDDTINSASSTRWSGREWRTYVKDLTSSDGRSRVGKVVSWAKGDPDAIEPAPLLAVPPTVSKAPNLRAGTDDVPTASGTTSKRNKFGSFVKGLTAFKRGGKRSEGRSSEP